MPRHKHADVIHAWAEGEEIECRQSSGEWVLISTPRWDANEYRIKPKIVKREGWVNVYPTGYSYGYPTKEEADHQQGVLAVRVACIRIEWEEEV